MIILILFVSFILYSGTVAGFSPFMARQMAARCGNCSLGKTYELRSSYTTMEPGNGHEGTGFLLAAVWPLTLPYMLVSSKSDPRVRRGLRKIEAYWEQKEITEREEELRAAELRAGIH